MPNRVIVKGNVGNALHSVAPDRILGTADEIFDESSQEYQSEINAGAVRADKDQSLTEEQKAKALKNQGVVIAQGSDFTNPDARAKVPTVGAVLDGLNDGVYDVSKRNPTGGPNSDGKFTLEYILTNANTLIPNSWRHGGMLISFVDSSDNNYIQARLMADAFTTDITKWQVVDDEPTAGSKNLIVSGGVYPIAQSVNIFTLTVKGGASRYGNITGIYLQAGRRYHIEVKNQSGAGNFKDKNGTVIAYISSGTYNKDMVFTKDVYSINSIYGEGSEVTVTPIDILPAQVFKTPILHTDNDGCNCFIEEIVLLDSYDSARVQFDVSNKWIKIFGTKNSVETALTDYFRLVDMASNRILPFGSNAGYIIVNKDYFPTVAPGTVALLNYTLEYNQRIKELIDTTGLLREKTGVNLIKSLEWGKGVNSNGGISSNQSWLNTYAITNKIYFGDNNFITCCNCSFGQGFRCATYDATDTPVSIINPTGNITTIEKTDNAVYAIFTITNNLGYNFTPQAQVGATRAIITPYEQYSEVGGYLPQKVFYCGPNRPYTTLKSAIEAATKVMGGVLYVDSGVYDLIEEFGDDYFASLTSTSDLAGIKLCNRVHIVFSPNAIVKCHYEGDNKWAMKMFSAFNAGEYGFTIENLHLEASKIRYAIHDEYASNREICISKYINCEISFDNSQNTYWASECVIGGGLGCATEVDIQGCTFNPVNNGVAIYYHQIASNSITDYSSKINIKNNYLVQGVIEFDFSKENADNPTIIQVSGNSMPADSRIGTDVIMRMGSAFTYNIIHSWNNEIRS